MIRKHASLIIATSLLALLATACFIRTSHPPGHRAHPSHVEKHKKSKYKQVKHKKHKKHH